MALATLVGFLSTLLISLSNIIPTFAAASSISLTPETNSVEIDLPEGGGSAYGSHELTITANDIASYKVTIASKTNSNAMTSSNPNAPSINSITGDTSSLPANSRGWAMGVMDGSAKTWHSIPVAGSNTGIINQNNNVASNVNKTVIVNYGVSIPNPIGGTTYKAEVQYTATAEIPAPTVTNLILNDTVLTGQRKEFALNGTNLSTASSVVLCPEGRRPGDMSCLTTNEVTIYLSTSKKETEISFTNPLIQTASEEGDTYDLYVRTDGGTSPDPVKFHVQRQTVCKSGDSNDNCQVDIDANMIPVKYVGNTTTPKWAIVTNKEDQNNKGEWYDYGEKKWANAITLSDSTENGAYCSGTGFWYEQTGLCSRNGEGDPISPLEYAKRVINGTATPAWNYNLTDHGVLGYWVYIPRYAYEVQRRDATDKFVMDEYELPDGSKLKNDFIIKFEKSSDTKKEPTPGCSTVSGSTLTAKDYRTECNLSRQYGNATGTTWATHPAFTFGNKELNGIWVGKFETTGTRTNPTIKPNQHANIGENIGNQFTMAKSIGVVDNNAVGGNTITGIVQNSHNLQSATTHMLKNSEWGAVTYLASSSPYGVGVNNVQINSAYPTVSTDADGTSSRYGITGCGPYADGWTTNIDYNDGTPLTEDLVESPTACSQDTSHAYNGELGKLASTTNNIYGIYDMSGGTYEYVMGNYTASTTTPTETTSSTSYFKTPAKTPYVDFYKVSDGFTDDANDMPVWSNGATKWYWNNDVCTWTTCGGQALHETKTVQSVSSYDQSWGGDNSSFVDSSYPWFYRGGSADDGSIAGLFYSDYTYGYDYYDYGFRVSLLATQ